jgi:photosystem II stability/assembly factor-like uncharacterized protein
MHNRPILAILFGMAFTTAAMAQYWTATEGPPAAAKCMATNSKQHVFVGTTSSAVYRSTDLGDTWVRFDKGIDDGGPNFVTINQLVVDKKDVIYAAVNNYGILRSTDDGQTWQKLDIGISVASSARLSVSIEDMPNNITAVFVGYDAGAANLHLRYSEDGGETFVEIPKSNLPSAMSSIYETFLSPNSNKMFILVAYNKGLYRTTNNGTSWTRIDSDPQSGESNDNFLTMRAHPNGTLYLGRNALSTSTKSKNAVVLRSTNDGESWQYLTQGWDNRDVTNNIVTGIAFGPNGTDVWALTSFSSGVFYSSNGGNEWVSKNDGLPGDGSGQGIVVTSGDHVFIAPNGEFIHRHLSISSVDDLPSVVKVAGLSPNPARDRIFIKVELTETSTVVIDLVNMNGDLVSTPYRATMGSGPHTIELSLSDLSSGLYAWRMVAGASQQSGTFHVIR